MTSPSRSGPTTTSKELLNIAFKDPLHPLELDHPALKKLRGESLRRVDGLKLFRRDLDRVDFRISCATGRTSCPGVPGGARTQERAQVAPLGGRACSPGETAVSRRRRRLVRRLLRERRDLGVHCGAELAQHRPTSSICLRRVQETSRTASRRSAGMASWARWRTMGFRPWMPWKRRACATWCCAEARGPRRNAKRFSTTAPKTWTL